MKLKTLVGNDDYQENCYLLEKEGSVLVIDPGCELEKIEYSIDNNKMIGILITHHHFDHIVSLDKLIEKYNVMVLDNTTIESSVVLGPFKINLIKTPGHSKDSVTYYLKEEKMMFTGDFVFYKTIGRCDLPGGSFETMMESIELIKTYPDDIKLYPGHAESTTLGDEKRQNSYFIN